MVIASQSELNLIRNTFADLDKWSVRLASVFEPAPESELARDDLDWPPLRISEVARSGLGSANDHLRAVKTTIEAQQLFPLAQLSLIRAALVGASQAVWVLSPDDPSERTRRARTVALEWHEQQRKFLNLMLRLHDVDHGKAEEQAAFVDARCTEIQRLRALDQQVGLLNVTDMIAVAARSAFPEERYVDEALSVWRVTSGTAHGLSLVPAIPSDGK